MRRIVPLLLVLIVLLAGCSGSPAPSPSPTQTPTETESPTPTDGLPADFASRHLRALQNAETVTLQYNFTAKRGKVSRLERTQYRLNLSSGEHRIISMTPGTDFAGAYSNGTVTYNRYVTNNSTRYERIGDARNVSALAIGQFPQMAPARWERNGTRTFHGTTVTVYQTTDPKTLAFLVGSDAENVTAARGTLLIDDRGVIHGFSAVLRATTEQGEVMVRFDVEYFAIGTTTVERPSWVSEAKQQT